MTIETGQRLPNTELGGKGPDGPYTVQLADYVAGRRVVIFGVPGAFTPTCSVSHMPSFVRTAEAFADKGIDEIICLAVNDVHVLAEWGRQTGATAAGITLLSDVDSAFGKAMDITFSVPPLGMLDRLARFALVARDGVIEAVNFEEDRGVCDMTAGETLLDMV